VDRRDWDRRYEGSELLWSAEPNQFLVAEVADLPPGRALDLAAGEGRNAVWLAERGWEVTAVDFSEVALEKAARLAEGRGVNIWWVVADLRTYTPPPDAFELVLVLYLHLPRNELREILPRAAGALVPGGILLVVGHDRLNLVEGHGGPSDPDILYTPEEIAGDLPLLILERAGRVRRPVATDLGEAQAVDTLVRARRPSLP
jgi:SAM-dependent methyltransferase